MKDADTHKAHMLRRVRTNGCVLMLDFDGVLSPLVRYPRDAKLSVRARAPLAACARRMPVAILTGRALLDIENRVGIDGIAYAGSHGLEWKVRGKTAHRPVPEHVLADFASAHSRLVAHLDEFPNLIVEDKRHCLALGYRDLSAASAARFRAKAREAVEPFVRANTVRVIDNQKMFEIIVRSEWTKGECARHVFEAIGRTGAAIIYIGDSLTDEDAFTVLHGHITIRVGKTASSAAHYFFRTRARVDAFLRELATVPLPKDYR